MIIREVLPAADVNARVPREERCAILLEVLRIPWLREHGGHLDIRTDGIYANDQLVATVTRE